MASFDDKPSYLKAAFLNVYNLSLLGGAVVAAAATGDVLLGVTAVGVEALWLLFGPDLRPFRRLVDRNRRKQREAEERARVEKLMAALPEREWARAHALDELRREIERDMGQNPSFQLMLVQAEVQKLSTLLQSFVGLAHACSRAETYLGSADPRELARQIDVQKGVERSAKDATVAELARRNIQVLEKRQQTIADIQNFLARARGQMNLMENTVRLLRDQVLTMASPDQLGEQLDDLISGVDAISATARDSEAMRSIGLDPVSPISAEPLGAPPVPAGERARGA
jgi:hypothetical protein